MSWDLHQAFRNRVDFLFGLFMIYKDIFAIIVSFNGEEKTILTVRALQGKVGHIHIVDNGSDLKSLGVLRSLEAIPGVSITYLPENRGVGHALNLGLAQAREGGYHWILTMDQDSLVDEGMIQAYCRTVHKHPDLACLAPTVVVHGERNRGQEDGPIEYAITSGNLVRLDVFQKSGVYDEAMFIDALDFDFCLRVRLAGWEIWRIKDALLYHELGDPHRVPKPFSRFYTLHSPTRRYYMYRNFLYLAELHIRNFPIFILRSAAVHLILLFLIPFFDKNPGSSLSAVWHGVSDYFSNNMGARLGALKKDH